MAPITGHFNADFATFNTAVQEAEIKLKSFEAGSNKVETALGRMTDSFSGRRVISEAALMVEAVDRIGGTSKLTTSELSRLAPVASEALAKMKAMGIDVPPGLRKIADETKGVTSAHGPLLNIVKDVAVGFAAYFTARAAADFVGGTIREASALQDLGKQTHVNVEELQLLAGAMSEFGVDADQLGHGLFNLSQKAAGGDESVARALHTMGLSLKDIEGLQGEQLFLKMERGLSTLQGSLRDNAAADLFGAKLGAAMAGASEGIDETLDKARKLNTVMSTESVQALDQYGESIERAQKSLGAMAANMLGPLAQGFNVVTDAADRGASTWALTVAIAKDWIGTQQAGRPITENLTRLLDEQAQAHEKNAAAQNGANAAGQARIVQLTAQQQAVKFMAALEADASKALTGQQLVNLAHLKEIGALTAANANAIGVNAEQFAKYQAEQAAAAETTKAWKEAITEINSVSSTWQTTLDTLDGTVVDGVKGYLAAGVALDKLKIIYGLTDSQAKAIESSFKADAEAAKDLNTAIDSLTAAWARTYTEEQALGATDSQKIEQKAEADYETLVASLQKQGDAIESHYEQAWAIRQRDIENGRLNRLANDAESRTHLEHRIKNETDWLAMAERSNGEYATNTIAAHQAVLDKLNQQLTTWGQIVEATKTETAQVKTLSGELLSAADYAERQRGGGSMDVTSQNFDDAVHSMRMDPSAAYPLAKAGYSFAEIVRILTGYGHGPIPPPQGPKIPGFKEGGIIDAGAGQLAMLHGKEMIMPLDQVGAPMVNNFYVNGTATDVANQIAGILMRQLKQVRQFGSA